MKIPKAMRVSRADKEVRVNLEAFRFDHGFAGCKDEDDVAHHLAGWCKAQGIAEPVRQHKPIVGRKFQLDFSWVEFKVAVELHGSVWRGRKGRHTSGAGFTKDREKMNLCALLGWIVIECCYEHVRNGKMIEWLSRALAGEGRRVLLSLKEPDRAES